MDTPTCLPVPADTSPPTPRTTADLVAEIVEVDEGKDLTPYIATANVIITSVCGCSGYTDGFIGSQMELIERWLSAHFYTNSDNQLISARAGTTAVRFQAEIGLGLQSSIYGQNAMRIDVLGNLAAMDNSAKTKRKIRPRLYGPGRPKFYAGNYWPYIWGGEAD